MHRQRQFPVSVVMLELDADVSRMGVSDGIGQVFLRAAVNRQIDRVAIAGLEALGADAKRDLRMPAAVVVHKLIDELGKRNMTQRHRSQSLEHAAVDGLKMIDSGDSVSQSRYYADLGFFGQLGRHACDRT